MMQDTPLLLDACHVPFREFHGVLAEDGLGFIPIVSKNVCHTNSWSSAVSWESLKLLFS